MEAKKIQQFREVSRQYSDTSMLMHEAIARKAGLSGTDHKYLGFILQKGEMTAGDLSKMTGLTTGAVTGLIDRLEKKGLAQRQFVREDRRKVIIVPNIPNVKKQIEPLFVDLQNKTTQLIRSMSEAELEVVEKYFRSAIKVMMEATENLKHQNL